jgi:hypothetical protein
MVKPTGKAYGDAVSEYLPLKSTIPELYEESRCKRLLFCICCIFCGGTGHSSSDSSLIFSVAVNLFGRFFAHLNASITNRRLPDEEGRQEG